VSAPPRSRSGAGARRLGVLGGTFDPPHLGHLALAEWARAELGLERVLFVPAAAPPHKRRALTPLARRLAMTRLAVRGNPAFAVSTLEARRAGPSYTVDTLRALAAREPDAELWLLLGADTFAALGTWREPRAIVRLARLAVAARPGVPRPRPPAWMRGGLGVRAFDNPGLAVSSSALRARVRAGRGVRYLVPDAVARFIAAHGLYRAGA